MDGNDPRRLSGTGSVVFLGIEEVLVRGRNKHANGQRSKDIEEQDAPENTAHCLGDVLAWVLRFTCSNGNGFDTAVRESRVDQGGKEREEAPKIGSVGIRDIDRLHRAICLPVVESVAEMGGTATEDEDKRHDQEADDGNDLDRSEAEFGLAVDAYSKDVETNNQDYNQGNPCCNVYALRAGPVLDNERCGRDFGALSDCGRVPILQAKISNKLFSLDSKYATYVPTDGKSHGTVDVASTELRDGTGKRQPSCHFTQALHLHTCRVSPPSSNNSISRSGTVLPWRRLPDQSKNNQGAETKDRPG